MSTFFKLSSSINIDEIGIFPQISTTKLVESNDYLNPKFYRNVFFYGNEKLEFTPIFDIFVLAYKSKRTNWLSSINGNLVDENILKIFTSHKIASYAAYPVSVEKYSKVWSYFFFYIQGRALETIDLNKTIFYETNHEKGDTLPRRYVKIEEIKNIEEWEKWHSKYPQLRIEKLVYKAEFKDYDMFKGSYFDNSYFVSERLKDCLEENKISGIMFEECNIKFG